MWDSRFHKKNIWLSLLLLISVSAFCQQVAENTMVCNNYLQIKGESNVNRFSFNYSTSLLKHKVLDQHYKDRDEIEISIPVREFKPSNPMMYEDFLSMMKESKYPHIYIAFSRQDLLNITNSGVNTCPAIRITIAGITRTYEIQCNIDECSGSLYLRGQDQIRFTDFDLKPPEKLLGMVKVQDKIEVNFGFIITFTDTNQLSSKF